MAPSRRAMSPTRRRGSVTRPSQTSARLIPRGQTDPGLRRQIALAPAMGESGHFPCRSVPAASVKRPRWRANRGKPGSPTACAGALHVTRAAVTDSPTIGHLVERPDLCSLNAPSPKTVKCLMHCWFLQVTQDKAKMPLTGCQCALKGNTSNFPRNMSVF